MTSVVNTGCRPEQTRSRTLTRRVLAPDQSKHPSRCTAGSTCAAIADVAMRESDGPGSDAGDTAATARWMHRGTTQTEMR